MGTYTLEVQAATKKTFGENPSTLCMKDTSRKQRWQES